jgi:hypothetical protein
MQEIKMFLIVPDKFSSYCMYITEMILQTISGMLRTIFEVFILQNDSSKGSFFKIKPLNDE